MDKVSETNKSFEINKILKLTKVFRTLLNPSWQIKVSLLAMT